MYVCISLQTSTQESTQNIVLLSGKFFPALRIPSANINKYGAAQTMFVACNYVFVCVKKRESGYVISFLVFL